MTTLEIILLSIIAYLLISTFLYALIDHKSMSRAFETLFGSVVALIILILLTVFESIRLIISYVGWRKKIKTKKRNNKELENEKEEMK